MKKSQAALEFLTTYGWAFMVIILMIGTLAYFGVLSPQKIVPGRCNFDSEIGCIDYAIANNGLGLKLRNNAGEPIIVDAISAATDKTSLSCSSSVLGSIWNVGSVQNVPLMCDFANSGLSQGVKVKLNIKLTYHTIRSSSGYAKDVQGEVYTNVGAGALPGTIFSDTFNAANNAMGGYNSYSTVPFSDNGNNVVKITGAEDACVWCATFYRIPTSISTGHSVHLQFKVDSTSTVAHFAIQSYNADGTYNRWAVIQNDPDNIYAQISDHSVWSGVLLPFPIKINTWYVIILRADDINQFYMRVYEKDNPNNFAEYSHSMPAGLNWQFQHWIYLGTAYIDNYFES